MRRILAAWMVVAWACSEESAPDAGALPAGPLSVAGSTCGDRHCLLLNPEGSVVCGSYVYGLDGSAPTAGELLCEWDGQHCRGIDCNGDSECGAQNRCAPLVPHETPGACRRGEGTVADRTACQTDEDCVPEPCCRPTLCVNRADAICRADPCCWCNDCEPGIVACRCVDGCCVTDYGGGCQ
jgi:hypothetical protein